MFDCFTRFHLSGLSHRATLAATLCLLASACATHQQGQLLIQGQKDLHEEHKALANDQEQKDLIAKFDDRYLERIKKSDEEAQRLKSLLTTLAGPLEAIPGGKLVGGLINAQVDNLIKPVQETATEASRSATKTAEALASHQEKAAAETKRVDTEFASAKEKTAELKSTLQARIDELDSRLKEKLAAVSKDPELVDRLNKIAEDAKTAKDPERAKAAILEELKARGLTDQEISKLKEFNWEELLIMLGLGGAAGAGAGRVGPSRSKRDVEDIRREVNAMKTSALRQ